LYGDVPGIFAARLFYKKIPGTYRIGDWTFKSREQHRKSQRGETIPARSRNHCCHRNAAISSRSIDELHMAVIII
jgi:hypothetical protein